MENAEIFSRSKLRLNCADTVLTKLREEVNKPQSSNQRRSISYPPLRRSVARRGTNVEPSRNLDLARLSIADRCVPSATGLRHLSLSPDLVDPAWEIAKSHG